MSVLMISSYDIWGGAAVAALRLHRGLRGRGVDCKMRVRRRFSEEPGVELLAPGPVARARSVLTGMRNRSELRRFGSVDAARQGFMTHVRGRLKPDWQRLLAGVKVINLHWVPELFDNAELFAALDPDQRLIWTLHDMNAFTGACHYAGDCMKFRDSCGACPQVSSLDPEDMSAAGLRSKQAALESLGEEQLTVVTPSHWLGEQSRKSRLLGRFNHRVIPYGLDTGEFRPMDREEVRNRLGIKVHERVLLMLSETLQDRRKGMDLLQLALESNFLDEPVCLLIVGAGHAPDTGIRTIELGRLEKVEAVAAAYNAADIFVAPSREDNLPNTVLESLACGTPVVAFDVGGMPDMIDPGETGLLARPGDSSDLGRCIRELLEHAELAGTMRERCREVAVKRYALDRQARDYVELFDELQEPVRTGD